MDKIADNYKTRFLSALPYQKVLCCVLLIMGSISKPVFAIPIDQHSMQWQREAMKMQAKTEPVIDLGNRADADHFKNINQMFAQGNYDGIIKDASEYLITHPKSGLAAEILGSAYLLKGDQVQAVKALTTAMQLDPNQPGPLTKLGIVSMENAKIDEAIHFLNRAIELDPSYRYAHQRLGMIYEYKQDKPRAILHYSKGLQGTSTSYLGIAVNLGNLLNQTHNYAGTIEILKPRVPLSSTDEIAHLVIATAFLATEQFEVAKQHFSRVLELNADSYEAKLGLAASQRGLGDNAKALATIDGLIAQNSGIPDAYVERGLILLGLGREKESDEAFNKARSTGANPVEISKRKAQFYIDKKSFAKAEAVFQESIRNGAADPYIYTRLSEVLQSQNKFDQAEKSLREGVKKFPDSAYIHLRLGSFLASLRRYNEALVPLEQALKLSPNAPDVMQIYSLTLAKAGKKKEAVDVAAKLYNLAPTRIEVAVFYATQLEGNKQTKEAERIYRDVLNAQPTNALAHNNLANLLANDGDLKQAEQHARQAEKLVNDNGSIKDTLGWILFRSGRHQEAAQILQKASELAPGNAEIWYHYGKALLQLNKKAEGKQALEKALSIDSTEEWVADARKLLKQLG